MWQVFNVPHILNSAALPTNAFSFSNVAPLKREINWQEPDREETQQLKKLNRIYYLSFPGNPQQIGKAGPGNPDQASR